MTRQACEGIKVLDFSWAAVGPMSVRYLADHGAGVIHVQSWSRPCFLSFQRPRKDDVTHPDYGYWPAMYNAGKYSITLNLKRPRAQDLVKQIITEWQPDILVESFTPGVMKSFGLDYESVKKLKSDIIYESTCIQGQYGPRSHYPGYGNLGANLAGFCYVSGWPDRDISPPYGAYTDFINMRYGAAHILAAMEYRRRTGKGVYLDHSQYETALHFMAPPLMDHRVNGRTLERNGNRLPDAAPHGVYPCKGNDRWVALAVFGDEQWSSFCDVIGNPGWSKESRFRTHPNRKRNEDELDRLVGEWTFDYTAEQVESIMQGAGLAANVVESVKDLFEDPQLKTRNHFRVFNHKVMGPMHFEGPSFKLSKTPDSMWCPAPYGEHNEYVFKEVLGMTQEEISDLTEGGAISTEADFHDMIAQMLGLK